MRRRPQIAEITNCSVTHHDKILLLSHNFMSEYITVATKNCNDLLTTCSVPSGVASSNKILLAAIFYMVREVPAYIRVEDLRRIRAARRVWNETRNLTAQHQVPMSWSLRQLTTPLTNISRAQKCASYQTFRLKSLRRSLISSVDPFPFPRAID